MLMLLQTLRALTISENDQNNEPEGAEEIGGHPRGVQQQQQQQQQEAVHRAAGCGGGGGRVVVLAAMRQSDAASDPHSQGHSEGQYT